MKVPFGHILVTLTITVILVPAFTFAQAGNPQVERYDRDLAEAEIEYKKLIDPIDKRIGVNQRAYEASVKREKAAQTALDAKNKQKAWYQKLIDDDETNRLQAEVAAAKSAQKQYAKTLRQLDTQKRTILKEKQGFVERTNINRTKADASALAAETKRREEQALALNRDYYTKVEQKKAAEKTFEQKVNALDRIIIQLNLEGLGDAAKAVERDKEILTGVRDQWNKGQDAALKNARADLDAAYADNRRDGIGPTQWTNEKNADDESFIDRDAVKASALTANKVAANALQNTQQDMSVQAFLEDYGKTALKDEKTGEWDVSPIKNVDWEKGTFEWGGVAERYGYYLKGAGQGTKDIVVDLFTLVATAAETGIEAVDVAADVFREDGAKGFTDRDKVTTAYKGGNFVADLTVGDKATAAKRREQVSQAFDKGAGMLDRKLEQTAAKGKKGVNEAIQLTGRGAVNVIVDPLQVGKASKASKLGKLDELSDVGKLNKAQADDVLKRLDIDEFTGRDKITGYSATEYVDELKRLGLEPQATVDVRGKKFHVSQPFQGEGGRTMVVAMEELADGKVVPRTFYLSGEHGVWRAAPSSNARTLSKGPVDEAGKFVNEGVVDLDAALQGKLDDIASTLGVKEVDVQDAAMVTTKALDLENFSPAGPKNLGVDAADAARALPGQKADVPLDQLPEGMRPDWADGLVSQSKVEGHPLYGDLERFVYKSQDGKTDWVINRAENGDVWIGSMQDATAGLTGQATRNRAWNATEITTQPFTKGSGGYVPAEGWKNPFNNYMAENLPGAPTRAPDVAAAPTPATAAGAATGSAARQGARATQNAAEREIAIRSSAMVPEHAEAFVDIARERGEIIMVRPVNPDSTAKIAADAATKGMNIKGKSTDWGPDEVLGLIPVDAAYSKLGNPKRKVKASPEEIEKYSQLNNKALGKPYKEPIYDANGKIVGWSKEKPPKLPPLAVEKPLLDKNGKPVTAADGTPLTVLAEAVPKFGPDGKPLRDAAGNPVYEAGNPITADYDLFAVGTRGERGKLIGNHPEMGTISENEVDTMNALNRAVTGKGYKGGKVVHHGPANRFANEFEAADFPIGVAMPNGDFLVLRSASEVRKFYERMSRQGYNMDHMPGWDFGKVNPAERVATARAGEAKRAARQAEGADVDKAPVTGPGSTRAGRAASKTGQRYTEEQDKKEQKEEAKDIAIAAGGGMGDVSPVDPIYFAFGPAGWLEEIDGWIQPQDESLVSLSNGWSFELESAIGLDSTNVFSKDAFTGAATQVAERTPPPPPPQKRDPPPAKNPPLEKPPATLVGQPPLKEEPVTPPKPPTQDQEPPKRDDAPPPPPPPPPKEKEIRIGRSVGGTIHFDGYSIACSIFITDDGDLDEVSTATVSASGNGGAKDYQVSLYGGYEFRLEHEIYSYGTYDFELKEVRDKSGVPMTIIGNRFASYKVGPEAKPCW
ncbi:MAG: hypothetical protein Cons2KO_12850 [Congregibacter sp.]